MTNCRLKALSLVSLHTTVSTLSGALLLWTVSQTLPALAQNRKVPIKVTPPTRFAPVPGVPPLGYPEQAPRQDRAKFRRYRLGVGDAIAVTVQRFADLSFQAVINTEGNVAAPLLGTVSLTGLTLDEARERLRFGFNRFVVDPAVSVSLVGQRAAQVTLTGEVIRPGFYTLAPNSQLSAALVVAGGATNVADLRSVLVRRTLSDGSIIEQRVDLFAPLQNAQPLPDLRLQDGDAVVVSKLEVGTEQNYDRRLVSRSSIAQPTINIKVLSYANGGVIGNVTLANGSTFVDVLGAIAPNADTANLRKVALIRFDPERGKAVTQQLDGKEALLGNVSQNVPLQNNDVIVVGRNLVGRITYALNTITQPFQSVLSFLLFFNNIRNFGGR